MRNCCTIPGSPTLGCARLAPMASSCERIAGQSAERLVALSDGIFADWSIGFIVLVQVHAVIGPRG